MWDHKNERKEKNMEEDKRVDYHITLEEIGNRTNGVGIALKQQVEKDIAKAQEKAKEKEAR